MQFCEVCQMVRWLLMVHWHDQSVDPHEVDSVAAFVMHDCAHSGMEEKHWLETRPAQATVRRTRGFMA